MSNEGNDNNMLSTRYEPNKDEITGAALIEFQKMIDLVEYKIIEEPTYVLVKELITVYKWSYQLCSMATYLPVFSDIIKDGMVKVEDITKFDALMYMVMGK